MTNCIGDFNLLKLKEINEKMVLNFIKITYKPLINEKN